MSILLALAHHQPLNSFFWLNMVGGSITLCLLTEATKNLCTDLVQRSNWLLT